MEGEGRPHHPSVSYSHPTANPSKSEFPEVGQSSLTSPSCIVKTTVGSGFLPQRNNTALFQVFGALLVGSVVTYLTFNCYYYPEDYPTEAFLVGKSTPAADEQYRVGVMESKTNKPQNRWHIILHNELEEKTPLGPLISSSPTPSPSTTTTTSGGSTRGLTTTTIPSTAATNVTQILTAAIKMEVKANNATTKHLKEQWLSLNRSNNSEDDDIACNFPRLNPFDQTILAILESEHEPRKPKCPKADRVYAFDYNRTQLIRVPLKKGKKKAWTNCCYKAVYRSSNESDDEQSYSKCYPLGKAKKTKIRPKHEFICIFCDSLTNLTLKRHMIQVFAHAPLKPSVEARVENYTTSPGDAERVNLVVLGWDATSHMNMYRTLPNVRKYLVENLSALWFDGFTKVGDNTYPAVLATTTGQSVEEAEGSCAQGTWFDECPLFWKEYAKEGYRTSFVEDAPDGGAFTYMKNGFKRQPVDYYLRPLAIVAEKHIGMDDRGGYSIMCLGPQMPLILELDYMKSLAMTMGKDKRYVQLMWSTSLTHDHLMYSKLGEKAVLEFMKWMESEGHLNHTIFVFQSDHGMRWGDIRDTPQGKIEENMPFMYVVFPPWLKKRYPLAMKNFALNRNRLTTPFDTHETFLDILHLNIIEDHHIVIRTTKLTKKMKKKKVPRGISLFLPIPKDRTCKMAGVDETWCVCDVREAVPMNSTDVVQGANYAVYYLNNMVAEHVTERCAFLSLGSIHSAQIFLRGKEDERMSKSNSTEIYEIGFVTTPGYGSFEATVIKGHEGKWSVSGTISRTNLYGNQSHCVDSDDMKKYCFCL